MRFLLDQDVYAATARFLRELGHDVVTAAQVGLARAPDTHLLAAAQDAGRILVTRDRDYGLLVFQGEFGTGVIYLRTAPAAVAPVHAELEIVISAHDEDALRAAFVTVEPGRHRFRRIPPTGADHDSGTRTSSSDHRPANSNESEKRK